MTRPTRYLSAADVLELAPSPLEALALAAAALAEAGASGSGATGAAGASVTADAAGGAATAAGKPPAAGRWIADWKPAAGIVSPGGTLSALRGDAPDGAPRLAVDREAFLTQRDAACAAVAARHLADPATEVLTVLGCNARGRAVVAAMHSLFPGLERLLCFDPDTQAQADFADEVMTTRDLASIVPPEPREAAEGAHVLVSCLAPGARLPRVELDWLQGGTLCVALDLDTGFSPGLFAGAKRLLVDHLPAWREQAKQGRFPGVPEPAEELGAVVAGSLPGRGEGSPILMVAIAGHPAVELALAEELARRAEAQNRGKLLSP